MSVHSNSTNCPVGSISVDAKRGMSTRTAVTMAFVFVLFLGFLIACGMVAHHREPGTTTVLPHTRTRITHPVSWVPPYFRRTTVPELPRFGVGPLAPSLGVWEGTSTWSLQPHFWLSQVLTWSATIPPPTLFFRRVLRPGRGQTPSDDGYSISDASDIALQRNAPSRASASDESAASPSLAVPTPAYLDSGFTGAMPGRGSPHDAPSAQMALRYEHDPEYALNSI